MSKLDTALRTAATGAVIAMSFAGTVHGAVDANPFGATALEKGYRLSQAAEAKCGSDAAKSKTAEAKCGSDKAAAEGKRGTEADTTSEKTIKEAKCGEAKCGGSR